MNLFSLHLASLLPPEIVNHQPRIEMKDTDLLDPIEVTCLLDGQGDIVAAADPESRFAAFHIRAQDKAAEIAEYLLKVIEQMEDAGLNGIEEVRRLHENAEQLQAYHLDNLVQIANANK